MSKICCLILAAQNLFLFQIQNQNRRKNAINCLLKKAVLPLWNTWKKDPKSYFQDWVFDLTNKLLICIHCGSFQQFAPFSGNIFDDESALTDVAPKKKRIRRTKKEMVEIKRLKKLKGKFQNNNIQCHFGVQFYQIRKMT